MKKIFTAAVIALFMMTSCSDDDSSSNNNNNSTDTVLLKKTIVASDFGTYTSEYSYDGNKVTSIVTTDDDGNETVANYTYSNGKLSKIEYVQGTEAIGQMVYSYNSQGKLSTLVDTLNGQRIEYTHNSNGTISTVYYTGDSTSQTDLLYEGVFRFVDGNITEEGLSNEHMDLTDKYTYDVKNSPMKNVFARDVMDLTTRSGGPNNVRTHHVDAQEDYTITYTYNEENYPITSIKDDGDDVTTTQYFYE